MAIATPPFLEPYALYSDEYSLSDASATLADGGVKHVPNHPDTSLSDSSVFLAQELSTPLLDNLYPHLHLFAKKSGDNIDALHRQQIKGRAITITEEARLHLIWDERRIFVKPIPACLLSYQFWETALSQPPRDHPSLYPHASDLRREATGFLRSYAFLIQHPSDLHIAREARLVPHDVTWPRWCLFITAFRRMEDDAVALRYHFGQLRLSRLNWAVRIFGSIDAPNATRWFCEIPWWSTVPYLREAVVPLVFFFAVISLALASMQVMLAVPSDSLSLPVSAGGGGVSDVGLTAMHLASWGFAISTLVFCVVAATLLAAIPSVIIVKQLIWGFCQSRKNTKIYH